VSTKTAMDTTPTGRRRNRSWPEAVKREIVAASSALGSSATLAETSMIKAGARALFDLVESFFAKYLPHSAARAPTPSGPTATR
jgi:hypothetical protein